jgi:hypothetical protein
MMLTNEIDHCSRMAVARLPAPPACSPAVSWLPLALYYTYSVRPTDRTRLKTCANYEVQSTLIKSWL